MTYRHYLAKTEQKDSMETYAKYLEEHNSLYRRMNVTMQDQHVKATYGIRFINNYR